jgi:hypothetical protein
MTRIVLISCVSQKLSHRAKAKDLYVSSLFKYNLKYAGYFNPDKIFILSAEHGLLNLEREIEPYNKTLNTMRSSEIKEWANNVLIQLKKETDIQKDEFIFLAGEKYRKYLIPHITNYKVPMDGLRIGEQLKYLKEKVSNE